MRFTPFSLIIRTKNRQKQSKAVYVGRSDPAKVFSTPMMAMAAVATNNEQLKQKDEKCAPYAQ